MLVNFIKMNACSNDFLVIDARKISPKALRLISASANIQSLANYKKSIGFDQLLIIEESEIADLKLTIYNNDGSEVEACGNGTRCVASLFLKSNQTIRIQTKNRILEAHTHHNNISVNMGKAEISDNIYQFDNLIGFYVEIGNPHLIIDISKYPSHELNKIFNYYGPLIEKNEQFPNKINVNFVQVLSRNRVILNTWERGVGETFACGSGACASFALLYSKNIINNEATIIQRGGDLIISMTNGSIVMSGDARTNYQGSVEI